MKKFFMILASTVMAMSVNAQVYVGGGIGVSTTGGDNTDDVTSYKFVPEIGYTINSEWAAGMAFGWEGSNKGGAKTFSINPYVRYNVINGKVVNVFLDGSVEFGHKYNAGFDDDFFGVGLKPGVAFKVNEKISVVTHIGFIGYEHWKNKPSKNSVNSWGVDVDGRNIILGIYYNI
ncbi:MAG: outer membrane beta-barrel protein [Prevotella sp.]|nr:outer membrane beta-barrel protein [Prevotella sp.]MBR3089064.1 outer membrane beta-barrel protein [Prevotella sp.]